VREGAGQTVLMEFWVAERKSHAVIHQTHLDGKLNMGLQVTEAAYNVYIPSNVSLFFAFQSNAWAQINLMQL